MRLSFLLLLLFCQGCVGGMKLSQNSLGDLSLQPDSLVSEQILHKSFPGLAVEHGIGEGDSANFHYYRVSDGGGELLFTIYSYIDSEDSDTQERVIDSVVISSPGIADQYGVSVGDSYSQVLASRGGGLEFGASHHDNYLGSDNIWYSFSRPGNADGVDISPESVTREDLARGNPTVKVVSWPSPGW